MVVIHGALAIEALTVGPGSLACLSLSLGMVVSPLHGAERGCEGVETGTSIRARNASDGNIAAKSVWYTMPCQFKSARERQNSDTVSNE